MQCELMGVIIFPVPPPRNGSDVHNLWGVWVCATRLGTACSQLDRCGRREKLPEEGLPRAVALAWLSALFCRNLIICGLERRPKTSISLGSAIWRQWMNALVLLLMVASVALSLSPAEEGAFEQPWRGVPLICLPA